MKISRFLMLLIAMTMMVFTACDDGNSDDPVVTDKCENVTCTDGKVCDPGSGECVGGTVNKCDGIDCVAGQACDLSDGLCKDIDIDGMDTIVKARIFSSSNANQAGIILTEPLEGVVVAVRGIASSSKHAVVIRQADANEFAGIYVNLNGIKGLEGFPELAIGNLITVEGKLIEYFDRTELQPEAISDLVVKSASVTVPAPIDVTSFGFEEKYESMVLNITNVPFTVTEATNIISCTAVTDCPTGTNIECKNGMCSNNVYDTTLTDANDKTVKISSSFSYPRYELALGDVVSKLAGVMTFDYGEFKLYPRDVTDVGATASVCDPACGTDESCVNSECVPKVDENTNALCSDNIDNDGDGHTDCDDWDCSDNAAVTVCLVECAGTTCASGEVCISDVCKAPVDENTNALCDDGIDNDGNGHIDCADWSCSQNAAVTICVVTCGTTECTAGQVCDASDACTDRADENTEAACDDGYDNDGNGFVDCNDNNCDGTTICGGTADLCAGVDCSGTAGQVCDPSDGVCKDVETKTLAEIRTAELGLPLVDFPEGGTYNSSGTVTAILATGDNMGFYMQDATGGIMVYTKTVTPTVALGDTVDVTGTVGNYFGLLRFLEDTTIGAPTAGSVPAATEMAPTAANLVEANEGMFVKFTGGPFVVDSTDSYDNTLVKDDAGNEFFILNTLFDYTTPVDDSTFTNLQGILTYSYGKYRLMPRDAGDMAATTFDCSGDPCDDAFEYCSADDVCSITSGMCDDAGAGCDAGYTCTANVCELTGSATLLNGDFEAWTDATTPEAWLVNDGLVATQDTTTFHGGANAAKLVRQANATNTTASLYTAPVTVTVGKTYALSAWAYDANGENAASEDKDRVRIAYTWLDANGDDVDGNKWGGYTTILASPDWEELTLTTEAAPAGSVTLKVFFRVYGEEGLEYYLDDATVTEQ